MPRPKKLPVPCPLDVKPIPGYEKLYGISKCGKIWSYHFTKFLKEFINNHGYVRTSLYKNKEYKGYQVHRLVLLTYVGPSDLDCNHKNSNKIDNRLENLEYVTRKENIHHAIRAGTNKIIGEKSPCSKLTEAEVLKILFEETGKYSDIGKKYGVLPETISMIKRGKNWKHLSQGKENLILIPKNGKGRSKKFLERIKGIYALVD